MRRNKQQMNIYATKQTINEHLCDETNNKWNIYATKQTINEHLCDETNNK